MLTDQDIQKLTEAFATKQDVKEIREDIAGLRESVQGLVSAVDKLTKAVHDLRMEYAAVLTKLNRHEKWIKMLAEKAGVELEV